MSHSSQKFHKFIPPPTILSPKITSNQSDVHLNISPFVQSEYSEYSMHSIFGLHAQCVLKNNFSTLILAINKLHLL